MHTAFRGPSKCFTVNRNHISMNKDQNGWHLRSFYLDSEEEFRFGCKVFKSNKC